MKNQTLMLSLTQVTLQLCAALLFCNDVLMAQTNTETNSGIQFNFLVPGARSLALGGAFLARADDATTAYTNPAGLTTLSRTEVSIEGRSWGYTHEFTDAGRVSGFEPTGAGVDTIEGLTTGEADNRVDGLSFFSYIYPASKRWRVAFYRHELANFEASFESQGNFRQSAAGRNRPTRAKGDLHIANYGASAAFVALGDAYEPKLSVGIGLSYYDFSMDFLTQRFAIAPTSSSPSTAPGGRYGPALYADSNFIAEQIQKGQDEDLAINFGVLWNITRKWTLGGVYRQGPDFDLRAIQQGPLKVEVLRDQPAKFHVPDVYGLGIAFSPTRSSTFSFDYNRVEYSQIIDDMVDIYSLRLTTTSSGELRGMDPGLEFYRVDDANQLHLGFEKIFFLGESSRNPLALRFGTWIEPDHRIRFEIDCADPDATATIVKFPSQCYRFLSLYQPGEDEIHYSAGFGIAELAIGTNAMLQVDVAFDHSKRNDTASVSTVFRFR